MSDMFEFEELIADMLGGAGTNSMIGLAKKCSIPVIGYTSLQSVT